MSIVSAFATAAATQAFAQVGEIAFTIGGTSLTGVPAELEYSKTFEGAGNERIKSLKITFKSSLVAYSGLLKKTATITSGVHSGQVLRVEAVSAGEVFTTITLEEITKA